MPPRRLRPPLVSREGIKQPPRRGEIGHGEYRAHESTDLTRDAVELREALANTERRIIVDAFYTSTRTAYITARAVRILKKNVNYEGGRTNDGGFTRVSVH